jgi:dCTP deaminase
VAWLNRMPFIRTMRPGYRGIITLELCNLGQIPIALYPGLRVAQIAFLELAAGFDEKPRSSQFHMAFEPISGKIADREQPFLVTPQE